MFFDKSKSNLYVYNGLDNVKQTIYDLDGKLISSSDVGHVNKISNKEYIYNENHKEGVHFLTSINVTTGKESEIYKIQNPDPVNFGKTWMFRNASFSRLGDDVVVAFGFDNKIYRINPKGVEPLVQFTFSIPPIAPLDKCSTTFQGYIGDYICIYYFRNSVDFLYLMNSKTGKCYQTKVSKDEGIKDDINGSGFCRIMPIDRPGYSYYKIDKGQITDTKLKDSDGVIYFVKMK